MTFIEEEPVISVQKYPLLCDKANAKFHGRFKEESVEWSLKPHFQVYLRFLA